MTFKRIVRSDLGDMNELLGFECGLDGNVSAFIYGSKDSCIQLFMGVCLENVTLQAAKEFLAQ